MHSHFWGYFLKLSIFIVQRADFFATIRMRFTLLYEVGKHRTISPNVFFVICVDIDQPTYRLTYQFLDASSSKHTSEPARKSCVLYRTVLLEVPDQPWQLQIHEKMLRKLSVRSWQSAWLINCLLIIRVLDTWQSLLPSWTFNILHFPRYLASSVHQWQQAISSHSTVLRATFSYCRSYHACIDEAAFCTPYTSTHVQMYTTFHSL